MKILNAEATYDRTDETPFKTKAFLLSGSKMEQFQETVIDKMETVYSLDDLIVRFVKYDPMTEIGGFYFQYHVMKLEAEDKLPPKKVFVTPKKEKIEKPTNQTENRFEKSLEKVKNATEEQNVKQTEKSSAPSKSKPDQNNKESYSFFTNEELQDISGQELMDVLESGGQQTLF